MGAPRTQATDKLRRRALALWCVALWLLGFELAPNLHLGFHGELPDHSHRSAHAPGEHHESPDAAHHEHHHEHGHGEHHHHGAVDHHDDFDVVVAPRPAVADGPAVSSIDLGHGDHDLLHRGVAALPPPPAMPQVAQAPFAQTIGVPDFPELLLSRAPADARARGPPADPTRASSSAL
jgi:hypothetical protein